METFRVLPNFGRGYSAKDLLDNVSSVSQCPPPPMLTKTDKLNVASGRAAQVLRQIKQSSTSLVNYELSENQLFIRCAITPWYKYNVEFQPTITSRTTRFMMINHMAQSLGGLQKLYDGQYLYVPSQLSKEFFLFDDSTFKCPYEVRIRFIDTLNLEQIPIDLINILFRSAIDHGRESILTATNRQPFRPKVRSWNGKIVHLERKEDGLLLTVDFIQKATTTCYEELERFYVSTNYQEYARKDLLNKLVLTRYDNRTQRIDEINFQLTPATLKINDETTLVDYYLSKFDIIIQDPDQPLIVYCPRRTGDYTAQPEEHYLVPELCYLTGLSDRAHRNARARKTNHIFRLDSAGRRSELMYFDDLLRRNPSAVEYLARWGMDVVSDHLSRYASINESGAKTLHDDSSLDDDEDNELRNMQEADFSYGHFANPIELTSWLLIYPKIDEERAASYVNMLRLVGQQQGMVINEPSHIQMNDDETETYAHTLRRYLNKQIQLVSIIVKSRRIDRYNLIKRICCVEIPTASEIVLRSTIADDDNLPSIALNIARDINFKLGGEIRPNNIILPNAMLIGLSTWTVANVNYQSSTHLDYVLAIVGSINGHMTEYFSHAKSYSNAEDLRSEIGLFVRLAIDAYYEENKIYPTTIIIGRNVFSTVDDLQLIKDEEIPSVLSALIDQNPTGDYRPRLVFFTWMKHMVHDFYRYVQPKKVANVDCLDAQDSPSYCFYLSSHRDRCSSLQARQFLVLFDNTDLSAQKIQRLILYLTHHIPQRNHFFVPSICRFAQRLSSLVGETLGVSPNCDQYKHLFYL